MPLQAINVLTAVILIYQNVSACSRRLQPAHHANHAALSDCNCMTLQVDTAGSGQSVVEGEAAAP